MSEMYPKDGSTFVTESIDRTAYRWAKYKPDGARQMGKPGRWQKQVWHGEWFKWENCEEPTGEISSPIEDGPISKAFKEAGSLDHWRHEVGKLHSAVAAKDAEIEAAHAENNRLRGLIEEAISCLDDEPEYHDQGMGCGLEDRGITDRYEAMSHGWDKAMERVYGENIAWANDALSSALKGGDA